MDRNAQAVVNVSIVNWVNGPYLGKCVLQEQLGDRRDSDWKREEVESITSALTSGADVSGARDLIAVTRRKLCFEGQQPGHKGFRIGYDEYKDILGDDKNAKSILFPYLNGNSLLSCRYESRPEYIIDFGDASIFDASRHEAALKIVENRVLPKWKENAESEYANSGSESGEHQNRLKTWWQLKRPRSDMLEAIGALSRYMACVRHTKRPLFVFIDSRIRPDSALTVFAFEDDYSFGILQSDIHWHWFVARCSTIKRDFRYTNDTVFTTFPWPQSPKPESIARVAAAAVELRALRWQLKEEHNFSFRELYRTLELPGASPLKSAHEKLDKAVRDAYGMKKSDDPLAFLLDLNQKLAKNEDAGENVLGPGLPPFVKHKAKFVTDDFIRMPTAAKPKAMVGAKGGAG